MREKDMVEVVRQSRWSWWRYEEIYRFEVAQAEADVRTAILSFFDRQRIRDLSVGEEAIQFQRGSVLGSIFSPVERHSRQVVRIEIEPKGEATQVTCVYSCFNPIPDMHFMPRTLQREAERLQREICAPATNRADVGRSRASRLLFAAAVLWVVCICVAVWSWFRYSYCWDVTPKECETSPKGMDPLRHGPYEGAYVRVYGRFRLRWGTHDMLHETGQPLHGIAVFRPNSIPQELDRKDVAFTGRIRSGGLLLGARRWTGTSIVGLIVGVTGGLVFVAALRSWFRESRAPKASTEAQSGPRSTPPEPPA